MNTGIQAVRGMNDLLPEAAERCRYIEATAGSVLAAYGYREIRLPVVERTELFARSIGEATDIVEKEMYTFEDRNGDRLSLRPEATAGCVRAAIQGGLLRTQAQRLWYAGPMFRHERPQRGRYRQFHQVGAEAFGMPGPDIDAELILLTVELWRRLGLRDLQLQINSLGTPAARAAYRERLVAYLERRRSELDADSLRRLQRNPLRILDSTEPAMQAVIREAPTLEAYLDEPSRRHFEKLQQYLNDAGVNYVVNPRLVRGLDYYTRTVFEWVSDRLGAQDTVCAGGRYDGLVEQLGGPRTPAAGFALGVERVAELPGALGTASLDVQPEVFVVMLGERAERSGMRLAEQLRRCGRRVQSNCGGGSLKAQLRRADRSGAAVALILGEDEVQAGQVSVKALRVKAPQQRLSADALEAYLDRYLPPADGGGRRK